MEEQSPQPPAGGTEPAGRAKARPWMVVVAAVAGVLLCGGGGAFAVTRVVAFGAERDEAGRAGPAGVASVPSAPPVGASPGASATPVGPRAGAGAVRGDDDLGRVCDGWFYPTSPRFAGKAPHQITVGVVDSKALPSRHVKSSVDVPDLRNWRAWTPADPARTQLVGCVDLAGVGETVRTCKFDDPEPKTPALRKATYRVRLFETATGRKLLDKSAVDGADQDCPSVAFLVGGEPLASTVSDRQLYELFRPYVMRK
ncbi:hypothetical protein GCM10010172_86130 [Paractinoplanes ferrugineus]|uniref:Uncharacterized protein n=1 Tax=Paractinoplanes ferrugineus TaxID=113564 RepID=A0A919J6X2_9ACTN|nr:hypothetical protein [Actinoplanes ferrugineus]GIE15173.1 hypothetical protein Afe05nite_70130 [Actinoplanes ferrugineus]